MASSPPNPKPSPKPKPEPKPKPKQTVTATLGLRPSRPEVTLAVTAGALLHCRDMDYAPLTEFPLKNARRADVLALDKQGKFHLFEVKSSKEDFLVDQKWHHYLDYCDHFSFVVNADFPQDLIPQEVGLILADAHGWHAVRAPFAQPLHASRRKALTVEFARRAARRGQPD